MDRTTRLLIIILILFVLSEMPQARPYLYLYSYLYLYLSQTKPYLCICIIILIFLFAFQGLKAKLSWSLLCSNFLQIESILAPRFNWMGSHIKGGFKPYSHRENGLSHIAHIVQTIFTRGKWFKPYCSHCSNHIHTREIVGRFFVNSKLG